MPYSDLGPHTQKSIEQFDALFQIARMRAAKGIWPELQIEIREFGPVTAIRMKPGFLRKNVVLGFTKDHLSLIKEICDYYKEIESGFVLSMPYGGMNDQAFDALSAAGMRAETGHVMAIAPTSMQASPDIVVREARLEDQSMYLDIYQRSFATQRKVTDDEIRFQQMNDNLSGSQRFIAEIGGTAVGMGCTNIIESTAYLSTAGVLPEFRGRGIHQALIKRRVTAAHEPGCSVAMGGGDIYSRPMRNFAQCGFNLIPLGMTWWLAV